MRSSSPVGALGLFLACGCPGDDPEPSNTTTATSLGSDGSTTTLETSSTTTGLGTTNDATTAATGGADSTTGPTDSSGSTTSTSTDGSSSSSSTTSASSDSSSSGGEPQNLLDNPSLEQWASAMDPNTTPDLWVNCSTAGIGVDAVPDSCGAVPGTAADGLRYARAVSGEGIEQTIDTVAGTTYEISFSYCGVTACFGSADNSAWDVVIDGVIVDTTPQGAGTVWTSHALQFVAQGPTTTLCFRRSASVGQGGIDALAVFEL